MKNLLSTTLTIFALFNLTACEHQATQTQSVAIVKTEDTLAKITAVKSELVKRGYDSEMISSLFGDDNFYFPKTKEELDLTIYIVDHIIDNGQYAITDKTKMIELAQDAFELFKDSNTMSQSH